MNFDNLTQYLDSLGGAYGVPGLDCKVVRRHREIYRHQCGCRDFAGKVPVDGSELYDIYSATKVVTMVAAMQLVEKGVIGLNDPVTKYLPMFKDTVVVDDMEYHPGRPRPVAGAPTHKPQNPIILADLMGMTSGMSYDNTNPIITDLAANSDGSLLTMMEGVARLPLYFEPGTRYCYSLGHDVMGAVVEVASGERFADYLENHIFAPLGITGMTMHPGAAERRRMAAQWLFEKGTGKIVPYEKFNNHRLTGNYDSGGAGLCCGVDDYAAFVDALACGGVGANGARIISPESLKTLATPRLNEQQLADFGRRHIGYSYGLGVRTMAFPEFSKSPVGEFGWDGAAGAFCLVDTDNELSIFYAQEVIAMGRIYFEVHPRIRDLVYEAVLG